MNYHIDGKSNCLQKFFVFVCSVISIFCQWRTIKQSHLAFKVRVTSQIRYNPKAFIPKSLFSNFFKPEYMSTLSRPHLHEHLSSQTKKSERKWIAWQNFLIRKKTKNSNYTQNRETRWSVRQLVELAKQNDLVSEDRL